MKSLNLPTSFAIDPFLGISKSERSTTRKLLTSEAKLEKNYLVFSSIEQDIIEDVDTSLLGLIIIDSRKGNHAFLVAERNFQIYLFQFNNIQKGKVDVFIQSVNPFIKDFNSMSVNVLQNLTSRMKSLINEKDIHKVTLLLSDFTLSFSPKEK
ncbi:hypothetical protein [Flammeovirga agarivorans]|uniref:Uncharacterized protein n=1 Tax=Flammeovirga agarivorans TaxID=2726742 RepID=A0A7X8XW14_9BACT|nr:hypothetical protein [Flammeovirga agarivorans]NLR91640.1 hypothetical protein [Flammeovirga agarivorans]